jgi:AcrR family transcriptional regulator
VLLDAGLAVCDHAALSTLSVDAVVAEAGVAKGTFYVHFRDRADYLVALHRRFHDDMAPTIAAAGEGIAPGLDRLWSATIAYLDGCLSSPGTKAMLLDARAEPAIATAVAASNDRFARRVAPDLAEAGAQNPLDSARLYVAMAAEVALLELAAGRRRPTLRHALSELLGSTAH